MTNSLQRRLSVWLSIAIVVTGVLAAGVSFLLAHEDAKDLQDHMLKQIAALEARNPGVSAQIEAPRQSHAKHVFGDHAAWISVTRLPEEPRPDWLPENVKSGFRTLATNRGRVRAYVLRDVSGRTTIVAQPTSIRDEIAVDSALMALISLLVLLPLMVWLTFRIVRRQFAPVNQLASYLDAQSADRPDPVTDKDLPDEVIPFVHAINRLLKRVSDLVTQQRRFIADAAHELRSPLTALSVQSQNLKQSKTLDSLHERVLPLQEGIERARKLTEQLLSLARSQQAAHGDAIDVDISALARELIAEYLALSEAKNIDLGLDEVSPLILRATPETLRLVLRNGLENALKYTPEGGEVTLRLSSDESDFSIEIVDSGPGIPDSERERVFDPFYRMPGTTGEGSGLGLSIAKEAAISLGGNVTLLNRPDGSGLVFRYRQPRKH